MKPLTYNNQPMEYGTKCFELCRELKIGKRNYYSEPFLEFTIEEFDILKKKNLVFDGTKGGLILGNSHLNGGIHLINFTNNQTVKYFGEIEGWEYLTSPYNGFDIDNFEKFKYINEGTRNTNRHIKTEFRIPENCKVLDLRNIKVPFLLIDNDEQQAIINRFATKKHIRKLIEIDEINYS
ncbi:hypothetical protein FDT66_11115 [Polaribacter aestuariivivens]|uniref:Uncharacterized protein n=1 Tax=Polaribacter aestuariivivens TaxID=2304626 RepID=A0A5S3N2Y1_9FLAO|nr:hypothetical protein [Polaribacter aestuariivivens]TMM29655.1 hypothetical protein FDT66_11115 [Polaribacter aestuariivivens]